LAVTVFGDHAQQVLGTLLGENPPGWRA
jgi:hypothetical protein